MLVSESHMTVDNKREKYAYTQGKSPKVNSLISILVIFTRHLRILSNAIFLKLPFLMKLLSESE